MADRLRLTPDERANLVAYLDEELPDAERDALATKLAHSATARSELEAYKTVWDLLDHLSMPEASPELAERTLTRANLIVGRDQKIGAALSGAGNVVRKVAVWAAVCLGALVVGMIATLRVWPDPTARLARRLTIAEHLDEYETIGSFKLLELIEKDPNF